MAPPPPWPVKNSHKKDGCRAQRVIFHVSWPPSPKFLDPLLLHVTSGCSLLRSVFKPSDFLFRFGGSLHFCRHPGETGGDGGNSVQEEKPEIHEAHPIHGGSRSGACASNIRRCCRQLENFWIQLSKLLYLNGNNRKYVLHYSNFHSKIRN